MMLLYRRGHFAVIKFVSEDCDSLVQMNGDQMNGTGSDKNRKSAMNGKSKGFGNFFKRSSAKKAEKTSTVQGETTAS